MNELLNIVIAVSILMVATVICIIAVKLAGINPVVN